MFFSRTSFTLSSMSVMYVPFARKPADLRKSMTFCVVVSIRVSEPRHLLSYISLNTFSFRNTISDSELGLMARIFCHSVMSSESSAGDSGLNAL
jgi:hypothetical protein